MQKRFVLTFIFLVALVLIISGCAKNPDEITGQFFHNKKVKANAEGSVKEIVKSSKITSIKTQTKTDGVAKGLAKTKELYKKLNLKEVLCDGKDDNFNGQIDEGCDDDDDNYCDANMAYVYYSLDRCMEIGINCCQLGGDCDDSISTINPYNLDRCDGVDNNCDNIIDNRGPISAGGNFIPPSNAAGSSCLVLCSDTDAQDVFQYSREGTLSLTYQNGDNLLISDSCLGDSSGWNLIELSCLNSPMDFGDYGIGWDGELYGFRSTKVLCFCEYAPFSNEGKSECLL